MRRIRRIRHLAQFAALRAALAVARLLPLRARTAALSAAARGIAAFRFEGVSRENLRVAFGAEMSASRRRTIRRENARAFGRLLAELVDYHRDARGTALRLVFTDDSIRHLDSAIAAGRGAVVATPHFGNWELFPAFIVNAGYHGAVIGRQSRNPRLARELLAMRARAGVQTLDSRGSPRAPVRVLEGGGIVGVLPDLDTKRVAGEFIPFFGRPAFTATGPASLAVIARAPLVTAYLLPEGNRYRLEFEAPIVPDPAAPRREEILRITREWSRRFEARIRERPELWVWFHDRWATTPEKVAERAQRRAVVSTKPS